MSEQETRKIEKLTPEQEARLPYFRDKWKKIGLSTEPADHAKAEAAIIEAYAQKDYGVPKFVWVDSPIQAVDLATVFKENQDLDLDELAGKGRLLKRNESAVQRPSHFPGIVCCTVKK